MLAGCDADAYGEPARVYGEVRISYELRSDEGGGGPGGPSLLRALCESSDCAAVGSFVGAML